jgi:hypothetical protein
MKDDLAKIKEQLIEGKKERNSPGLKIKSHLKAGRDATCCALDNPDDCIVADVYASG